MARPEIPIDWNKVEYLLKAGCMGTEVAAKFAMHPQTFYNRVVQHYGCTNYTEFLQEMRTEGDADIRAKQYEKALGLTETGDNTLLIWLGKNRLGQKNEDKISISEDGLKALEKSMEILNHLQSRADPKIEKEIQSD